MSRTHQELVLNTLLAPHVSEKTSIAGDKSGYVVFKVSTESTKTLVKAAVEQLFKVEVEKVRISVVKGKTRRFRGVNGQCKSWKKAYVKLKEGHDIDFTGANLEGEK